MYFYLTTIPVSTSLFALLTSVVPLLLCIAYDSRRRIASTCAYFCLFSETGTSRAGLQHILERHSREFASYEPAQLLELAEASTSIGLHIGNQGRTGRSRPIYGLFFYGKPLAVAVQVGSNGFVVSMNPQSLADLARRYPQHGSVQELITLLQNQHSWPVV